MVRGGGGPGVDGQIWDGGGGWSRGGMGRGIGGRDGRV